MTFDPVDSFAISDVQQSFRGFEDDMAQVGRHDEERIGPDATVEAQDHKYVHTDPSMTDNVEDGAEKRADQNIVAQYFDNHGTLVNRYV
jgi:hypothetical protein